MWKACRPPINGANLQEYFEDHQEMSAYCSVARMRKMTIKAVTFTSIRSDAGGKYTFEQAMYELSISDRR